MTFRCVECGEYRPSRDSLVPHLSREHDLSRIEARKIANETREGPGYDFNRQIWDGLSDDEHELANEMRDLAWRKGEAPRPIDLQREDGMDREEYEDTFGSVHGARIMAGISDTHPDDFDHSTEGNRKYSEWDLVSELWRILEMTGKASVRAMKTYGKISADAYRYRFGSWTEALEHANIDGPDPSIEASRKPKNRHYAGVAFRERRQAVLERDSHECQRCGMTEAEHQDEFGTGLNVHHIEDLEDFDDPDEADVLENLETLCARCHGEEHPFAKE